MKKSHLIFIFLATIVCLIFLDMTVLQGVLTRDFTSVFVQEGMDGSLVTALIGTPTKDIGSGAAVMEFALPFQHKFYVTYSADATVANTFETDPTYPLRGMLMPALIAAIALLEAVIYFVVGKRSK